jgi:hypothetical protein
MKQNPSQFKSDSIWKAFGISSPEQLSKLTNELRLREEISDSVKKEFDRVKNLIVHSYSQFDFLDTAYTKASFILEMALKKRYEELEKKKCKMGYSRLITWAVKRVLFEEEEKKIRSIKDMRDKLAHPENFLLYGNISLHMIFRIKNIINGLYENTGLRRERKQEQKRVNNYLKDYNKNGAILKLLKKELKIFESQLIFYDNMNTPVSYYFLFYPLFDLEIINGQKVNTPLPLVLKTKGYSRKLNRIHFFGHWENGEARIIPINEAKDQDVFNKWLRQFNEHEFPLKTEIRFRISEVRNFLLDRIFRNVDENQNVGIFRDAQEPNN